MGRIGLRRQNAFRAQFNIAHPIGCGTAARSGVGRRQNHVELQAGPCAVVYLDVGRGSCRAIVGNGIFSCRIESPVTELHRLRVIGHVGRTCVRSSGHEDNGCTATTAIDRRKLIAANISTVLGSAVKGSARRKSLHQALGPVPQNAFCPAGP